MVVTVLVLLLLLLSMLLLLPLLVLLVLVGLLLGAVAATVVMLVLVLVLVDRIAFNSAARFLWSWFKFFSKSTKEKIGFFKLFSKEVYFFFFLEGLMEVIQNKIMTPSQNNSNNNNNDNNTNLDSILTQTSVAG